MSRILHVACEHGLPDKSTHFRSIFEPVADQHIRAESSFALKLLGVDGHERYFRVGAVFGIEESTVLAKHLRS